MSWLSKPDPELIRLAGLPADKPLSAVTLILGGNCFVLLPRWSSFEKSNSSRWRCRVDRRIDLTMFRVGQLAEYWLTITCWGDHGSVGPTPQEAANRLEQKLAPLGGFLGRLTLP